MSAWETHPRMTVFASEVSDADARACRCCKSYSGDLLQWAQGRRVGARFRSASSAAWINNRLDQSQFIRVLRSAGRHRPRRRSDSRAARQSSNGPCDQRKCIARGRRYASARKIFFAARARAKKFFFFLTRFVERVWDALGLVCLRNAATPDRLRIRSLQ